MKRNLLYLLFAAGVMLHLAGCSEERSPKADSAATKPAAAAESKPELSQKAAPEPVNTEPSQVLSTPVQATAPEKTGRATPETQDAARRAAMERFEQMRKQGAPARPE